MTSRLRRRVLTAAAVAVLAAGCSQDPQPRVFPVEGASPSDGARAEAARSHPKKRKATRPPGPRIDNLGHTRADRGRVARAIRTLKGLGLWDDLTGHLEFVVVRTRPGQRRIPEDGHLADSLYTVEIGPGPDGLVCDVVVFSEALVDDVALQNTYYAEGTLASPPPTVRQFWAVILGHEIAHCTNRGQEGEKRSTRWEHRILRALGVGRVGD